MTKITNNNGTKEELWKKHSTHGDFTAASEYIEHVMTVHEWSPNWQTLPAWAKHALYMETVKNARILFGDYNYKEHWEDKAGYAALASYRCSK